VFYAAAIVWGQVQTNGIAKITYLRGSVKALASERDANTQHKEKGRAIGRSAMRSAPILSLQSACFAY